MKDMQQKLLQDIVATCDSNTMASGYGRRVLAGRISDALNIWEDIALSFLQDMRGLDLGNPEDRETFLQFAYVGLV